MVIRVELIDDILKIEFEEPLVVASSAFLGGFREARYIIVKKVPKEFDHTNIEALCRSIIAKLGLDDAIVMLTAADIAKYVRKHVETPDGVVELVVTAGFSPPLCIDMDTVYRPMVSTINIIVATNAKLKPWALIDLVRTVIEAKAATIADMLLRCRSRSVGTVTDAIAVAAKIDMHGLETAGMATTIGNAVAKAVREAIAERAREELSVDDVLKNLIGVDRREIVELVMEIFRAAPVEGVNEDSVRRRAMEILDALLRDPNVWTFLLASRELDVHGYSGTIPMLDRREFEADSHRIIADELLAMALANYLAGSRAVLATLWLDRVGLIKRRVELPTFEDDMLQALVASIASRIYSEIEEMRGR